MQVEKNGEIVYDDSVASLTPQVVEWGLVINQVEIKAKKMVGEIMELTELLNLTDKQEVAFKASIKKVVYLNSNQILDWVANSIQEFNKDGKLVHITPEDIRVAAGMKAE